MGGLSKLSGGVAQGQGSSVGNAGPSESGSSGENVFNIASGGNAGFNPFASTLQNSQPGQIGGVHVSLMVAGVAMIGYLLVTRKK